MYKKHKEKNWSTRLVSIVVIAALNLQSKFMRCRKTNDGNCNFVAATARHHVYTLPESI